MGDSHVGLQARLMSQALRKLTGAEFHWYDSDLHQPAPREHGVMFGSPETTTGGKALKFYARCVSTCVASRHSRTAPIRSATGRGSRSSRTRCRHRSSRRSSTSSTGTASPVRAASSTWASSTASSARRRLVHLRGGPAGGQGKENARTSCATTPILPTRSRRRSRRSSARTQGGQARRRRGRARRVLNLSPRVGRDPRRQVAAPRPPSRKQRVWPRRRGSGRGRRSWTPPPEDPERTSAEADPRVGRPRHRAAPAVDGLRAADRSSSASWPARL